MSSEVDTNTLLVKAYMLALKDAVFSGGLNPNERFLLASNANRSIPASRAITKAVTNEAVYNEADLLLPLNSVAYTPGSGHESYLESLYNYFRYVEPGTKTPTQEDNEKLKKLKDDLDDAEREKESRQDRAENRYNKAPNRATVDFPTWCRQNAQAFLNAIEEYNAASGRLLQFRLQINGGDLGEYTRDSSTMRDAKNNMNSSAGVNMAVSHEPSEKLNETMEEFVKKGKVVGDYVKEPTSGIFYRPAYGLDPIYRDTMDQWLVDSSKPGEGAGGSMSLNIQQAKKRTWSEFGFENIEGNAGVSFLGFRIGAKGSSKESYNHVKIEESNSQVDINLKWKKLSFFGVTTGLWNMTNIREKYPRTSEPVERKTKLRPVQFLCASGFTIDCKVTGEAKDALDDAIQKQISAGGEGSVRVGLFGFDAGSDYEKGDGVQTSTYDWNKEDGKLSLKPTATFGNSTLLGVRAQEVTI